MLINRYLRYHHAACRSWCIAASLPGATRRCARSREQAADFARIKERPKHACRYLLLRHLGSSVNMPRHFITMSRGIFVTFSVKPLYALRRAGRTYAGYCARCLLRPFTRITLCRLLPCLLITLTPS